MLKSFGGETEFPQTGDAEMIQRRDTIDNAL